MNLANNSSISLAAYFSLDLWKSRRSLLLGLHVWLLLGEEEIGTYKDRQCNCSRLVSFLRKLGGKDPSQELQMSPTKEMLLPCSQKCCKSLGPLWSELRDDQLMQMDRPGSSAELSDHFKLSQLKQCQQALEWLFVLWLRRLPANEAWKASTPCLC